MKIIGGAVVLAILIVIAPRFYLRFFTWIAIRRLGHVLVEETSLYLEHVQ